MKQTDFEYLIMQDMQLPRALVKNLIFELTEFINIACRHGAWAVIPSLATFYVRKRGRRMYRNWRTGLMQQSPARNLPTANIWGYAKQQLTPTWIPKRYDSKTKTWSYVTYIGPKQYPDSDAARHIYIFAKIDLLTANHFINSFVYNTIERLKLGDKVVINHLGTFKMKHHIARNGRNPRTGTTILIPEFDTLDFRPSQTLIDSVN